MHPRRGSLLRGEPVDAQQVGPLVLVGLHGVADAGLLRAVGRPGWGWASRRLRRPTDSGRGSAGARRPALIAARAGILSPAAHGREFALRPVGRTPSLDRPRSPSPTRGYDRLRSSRGTGRESCALARVDTSETLTTGIDAGRPMTASAAVVASPYRWPPAPRDRLAKAGGVDRRGSAGRSSSAGPGPPARDVPRPGPGTVRHAAAATVCPAFQRRSTWLDQASARRALAVPPRGTIDGCPIGATSSQCSPELSVKSRRPSSAAA
jgi:hypothetical protein